MNVYIIDGGVRSSHVDFGGRLKPLHRGSSAGSDDNRHGTAVAAIIGGSKYGVSKGVMLYSLRVAGSANTGTGQDVIQAIDIARNHRRLSRRPGIINISISGFGKDPRLDEAVRGAVKDSLTVIVAAGNFEHNACRHSPGREPLAITVGATNKSDTPAKFSGGATNWGDCIDIMAPGQDIASAGVASDGAEQTVSGTSFAAPHVTGLAALYLEANPEASPKDVIQWIADTATRNVIPSASLRPGTPNLLLFVP